VVWQGCLQEWRPPMPIQRTENRNKPQVTDTHNRHVKDWFKWIKPTLPDATP